MMGGVIDAVLLPGFFGSVGPATFYRGGLFGASAKVSVCFVSFNVVSRDSYLP